MLEKRKLWYKNGDGFYIKLTTGLHITDRIPFILTVEYGNEM